MNNIFKLLTFTLVLITTSQNTFGEEKTKVNPRGLESFSYPFSNYSYAQVRYDRTNFENNKYFDTYGIKGAKTFKGKYHLKLDIPFASTNLEGKTVSGLSDIKVRAVGTMQSKKNQKLFYGYGIEITAPTASEPVLGSQKWIAKPELGFAYFLGTSENTTGSIHLSASYKFDFAGVENKNHIGLLGIVPNIDYWGEKWYIGYYGTLTYDFKINKWDIPLDIEFGYSILPQTTLAVEYIKPLTQKPGYLDEFAVKLKYTI